MATDVDFPQKGVVVQYPVRAWKVKCNFQYLQPLFQFFDTVNRLFNTVNGNNVWHCVTSIASFRNDDFIYKRNGYQDHGIYRTVENEFLLCVPHEQHV